MQRAIGDKKPDEGQGPSQLSHNIDPVHDSAIVVAAEFSRARVRAPLGCAQRPA